MSGFKGISTYVTSMSKLRRAIRELPTQIRSAVARDAVGWLTNETASAFNSGLTVYDYARPGSVDRRHPGAPLSLVGPAKSGRHVFQDLAWVRIGTILRAQLGQRHARFLVGKYKILPNNVIPANWQEHLEELLYDYGKAWHDEQARQLAQGAR